MDDIIPVVLAIAQHILQHLHLVLNEHHHLAQQRVVLPLFSFLLLFKLMILVKLCNFTLLLLAFLISCFWNCCYSFHIHYFEVLI